MPLPLLIPKDEALPRDENLEFCMLSAKLFCCVSKLLAVFEVVSPFMEVGPIIPSFSVVLEPVFISV